MPTASPLLIVGGGIGGLAAALALAARGLSSRLLERRADPSEAGAGIQIGPNGTRILAALGLTQALAPFVAEPEAIEVRRGGDGALITRLPLASWMTARHGHPYWVMHRADLHGVLLAAARAEPRITIETGCDVTAYAECDDHLRLTLASGRTHGGHLVIAADGLWSTARQSFLGTPAPGYTGVAAARAVVPVTRAPSGLAVDGTTLWLAPDLHMLTYPVRAGAELAMIVIFPEPRSELSGWNSTVSAARVTAVVADLAPVARALAAAAEDWRIWGLHSLARPPMSAGRLALLGDAAHPVKPYLAQGAVMALEDAVVLADCLAQRPDDPIRALDAYRRAREPRVDRIVAASETNGRIYHMSGPLALARDTAMRLMGGARLLERYDWLYGWRAE